MDDDERPADKPPHAAEPFDCVVCGVDGSPAAEEAVRQAIAACEASARIVLVSAAAAAAAAHPEAALMLDERALTALESARRFATGFDVVEREFEGDLAAAIVGAAERYGATVVAVGSHGEGRVAGSTADGVATAVVQRAPCSVLVARAPRDDRRFALRIVAGLDGSPSSLRATGVAERLAERLGADLAVVSAAGAGVDVAALSPRVAAAVRVDDRDPISALLAAVEEAELLVVGSRGLSGLRALGSTSERLARQAPVSVLVVRDDPPMHR